MRRGSARVVARRLICCTLFLSLQACHARDRATSAGTGATESFTVSVGYQRSSWAFLYLKHQGSLEARLAPLGGRVKWLEFTAGPPMLEGINVGSVDVALVGDAPPVFAQAGHLRFAYAAVEPAKPEAAAILVPVDSPLRTTAALKGKKVALQKGSSAHHLLIESLRAAGLGWGDIQPVYLAPPDARAAFEQGGVDAWAIWDPHFAAAELQLAARPLAGPPSRFAYRQFLVVRPEFPTVHRDAYEQLLAALEEAEAGIAGQPSSAAAALAADAHLDARILERALARGRFGLQPMSTEVWNEQQDLADLFAELHLLTKIPDVRAAALDVFGVQAVRP
jgi:sulfonate transport system substrate-binding protein